MYSAAREKVAESDREKERQKRKWGTDRKARETGKCQEGARRTVKEQ